MAAKKSAREIASTEKRGGPGAAAGADIPGAATDTGAPGSGAAALGARCTDPCSRGVRALPPYTAARLAHTGGGGAGPGCNRS